MDTTASDQRSYRLPSIDILRGLVIVIMALDHCRDFLMVASAQDPMAGSDIPPGLFFTRWITHFCAPVFVFLAGTSAGLMTSRRTPREIGRLLFTRGLWLVFVEALIVSNGWTFSPGGIEPLGGRYLVVLQVIWALGASMIVLGAAQFLGRGACLGLGAVIVLGHNLLDPVWPHVARDSLDAPLWIGLHSRMQAAFGPVFVNVAYPVLPWTGVMLLGFGASLLFERPPPERSRLLLRVGVAVTLAFLLVRGIDAYGESRAWHWQPGGILDTVMSFLNTTKYPPSLDYLLMTLGPAAIFLSFAERMRGAVAGVLSTIGRAPFAFYVAHIYLIHLVSIGLGAAQGFDPAKFLTLFVFYPKEGYGVPLAGVYVFWLLVVAALYPLSAAVARLKARRRDWWLGYL